MGTALNKLITIICALASLLLYIPAALYDAAHERAVNGLRRWGGLDQ